MGLRPSFLLFVPFCSFVSCVLALARALATGMIPPFNSSIARMNPQSIQYCCMFDKDLGRTARSSLILPLAQQSTVLCWEFASSEAAPKPSIFPDSVAKGFPVQSLDRCHDRPRKVTQGYHHEIPREISQINVTKRSPETLRRGMCKRPRDVKERRHSDWT